MNIIKPYAKMLSPYIPPMQFTEQDGVSMLKNIEYFTRISHRSEEAITFDSYLRIIKSVVMQHGDFSVIEHEKVSVEAVVDRGITHEWVRHRLGAYTQESTRFVNYKKKMLAAYIEPGCLDDFDLNLWLRSIKQAEDAYMELLNHSVPPQIARDVLPNCLAAKIIVTYNLRQWRHFFIMRTSKETHPKFKQVTIPLLKEFQKKIPILYDDIEPEQRQAEAMRRMR